MASRTRPGMRRTSLRAVRQRRTRSRLRRRMRSTPLRVRGPRNSAATMSVLSAWRRASSRRRACAHWPMKKRFPTRAASRSKTCARAIRTRRRRHSAAAASSPRWPISSSSSPVTALRIFTVSRTTWPAARREADVLLPQSTILTHSLCLSRCTLWQSASLFFFGEIEKFA